MGRSSGAARAATAMLVALALGWASGAPGQARSATVAALDPPAVVAPRLAFTDDSDELVVRRTDTYCPSGSCADTEVIAGGDHAGEASATRYTPPQEGEGDSQPRDAVAYVSSTETRRVRSTCVTWTHLAGEVVRVTCNTQVETHPVLSPDGGKVAYASKDPSGTWQISVAWLRSADDAQPLACADMPRVQATRMAATRGRPGSAVTDRLQQQPHRPVGRPVCRPARRAPGLGGRGRRGGRRRGAAHLQRGGGDPARGDDDAATPCCSCSRPPSSAMTGRWAGSGCAATAVAGSHRGRSTRCGPALRRRARRRPSTHEHREAVGNPYSPGLAFGYSTTDADPFGDVVTTVLTPTPAPGPPPTGEPTTTPPSGGPTPPPTSSTTEQPSVGLAAADPTIDFGYEADKGRPEPVSSEPGRSESHVALAHGYGTDVAAFTRRAHSADVSDVVATDGSARRVVASESLDLGEGDVRERDESAPTYSPDGSRIAYSRTTADGREIVTAAVDGTGIRALLKERPPWRRRPRARVVTGRNPHRLRSCDHRRRRKLRTDGGLGSRRGVRRREEGHASTCRTAASRRAPPGRPTPPVSSCRVPSRCSSPTSSCRSRRLTP